MSGNGVEYFRRLNDLNPVDRNSAETERVRALGYVWGFQDGSGVEQDNVGASEFSYAYGLHALDYIEKKVHSRYNVPFAYAHWAESGSVLVTD